MSFLRLGNLKKVVVVEIVWVVVVAAYTWGSLLLPSDLDDSDSLSTGNARDEFDSSPYAGGAAELAESLPGSSKLT